MRKYAEKLEEMLRLLSECPHEECLARLGLFSMERRHQRGDLIALLRKFNSVDNIHLKPF